MTKHIFTHKDYNCSNGFSTSIFGPPIWFILHIISFNYPVNPTNEDKVNYKNWLLSFQYVLPCIYCRNNFQNNLIKSNFNEKVFTNRNTFSKFIYTLHNNVNEMLGKNIKISYEEVRDKYENFRSRCSEEELIVDNNIKEKKCESSLYGIRSRSTIRIVPKTIKSQGLYVDPKCKTKKMNKK